MIFVMVESKMRQYAYGERRRPAPRPKEWMNMEEARTTIVVRDHLRAIRIGKELAYQVDPSMSSGRVADTPMLSHTLDAFLLGETTTRSR